MGREMILGVFLLLFSVTACSPQHNHVSAFASSSASAASLQKSLVSTAANLQDKSTKKEPTTRRDGNVVSVQKRGGGHGGRGSRGGRGRGGFRGGRPRGAPGVPGADNVASNGGVKPTPFGPGSTGAVPFYMGAAGGAAANNFRNGHRPRNAAASLSHNHIGCTSLLVAAAASSWILLAFLFY